MARTVLTPVVLVKNVWLNIAAAPVTVDAALVAAGLVLDAGISEHVMIHVTQTDAAAHDIIIRSIYGTDDDLVEEIALTSGRQVIQFETMKYELQAGTDIGKIYIDFETGFVGTIFAMATLK